ncbi:MAG TPA: hypothetical protein VGR63_18935 [Casimicrobiaceae bacterium]|jgi:hypothetical protein|nr:hypothetical protein [Casimicrobiaceae bacterium]
MTTLRAVLVGAVIAAVMIVAVRHLPVEEQKARAEPAISEQALREYGLRQAAVDALKAKVEPPMVLPTLEPFQPAPPPVAPPPPKIDPPAPPPTTMVAMRPVQRWPVERSLCSRFGMHKVQVDRWRWRCKR